MFGLPRQYPAAIQVRLRTCAHADVHVHSPLHVPVHVDTCAGAVACVHGPPFLPNRCSQILRGSLFLGSPHPGAVTPDEILRVFVLFSPAQFPPSYEAVARINDARGFVFGQSQQNIAMTSVCVCARVCTSVVVLVLPTLVCEHWNKPINSNRLLGLVV